MPRAPDLAPASGSHPFARSAKRGDGGSGGPAPRPRRRRWRWLLVVGAVLLFFVVAGLLAGPSVGEWYIERKLLPRLAERFGRQIKVGEINVSYGEVELSRIVVRAPGDPPKVPSLTVARAWARFSLTGLLAGRLEVERAEVTEPRLRLWRTEAGKDNFRDLLRRRSRPSAGGKPARRRRLRLGALRVKGGRLRVDDRLQGLRVESPDVTASSPDGRSLRAVLRRVEIDAPQLPDLATFEHVKLSLPAGGRQPRITVGGGSVRLLPRLLLSAIAGDVRYRDRKVTLDLAGSYGGARARLWAAKGWFLPATRSGRIEVKAARFQLDRISSILRATPVIRPQRTTVDGRLVATFERDEVTLKGGLAFSGLNLFHPLLARTPVLDLSLTTHLDAKYARPTRTLTLEGLRFNFRGLEATLTGTVARVGRKPLVDLRLVAPPVPCQRVLEAIPPSLVPRLQGFKLKGEFSVDLKTRIDYENLRKVELGGSVAIRRCKVAEAPPEASAERLEKPFDHIVEVEPGRMLTVVVGPDNPDFIPYERISEHVINVFLTTEDGAFFRHRGFIVSQFRAALARNLKRGGFRLGASTISMQMVKNVLLSHEKTLSRKLQELFLTWYLEQKLTKQRILEIYLNAIEFGPGIYGIGTAARHYFGKSAAEITPIEAAFFGTILPSPKRRYVHYCRGALSPKWDKYVRRVMRRMYERLRLSDSEYEAAKDSQLVFARDLALESDKDCNERIKEMVEGWHDEYRRRLRAAVLAAAPHQLEMYLKPRSDRGKRRPRRPRPPAPTKQPDGQ